MNTLKTATSETISQYCPHQTFWESHLGDMKSRSFRIYSDWVGVGKPKDGVLHQLRMDARHEYKRAILDCKKHFMCDSSNILSKCISSHNQKNVWAIWKRHFMCNDVNINMFGCSNYIQANEKLAANFIANTNDWQIHLVMKNLLTCINGIF